MSGKTERILVLAGADDPPVGGGVCARLDGLFDFARPEALNRVAVAARETGATAVAVLPGARTDMQGVMLLVAAQRERTVLAPAAWFPVLTQRGGVSTRSFAGGEMVAFPAAREAGRGWGARILAALLLAGAAPLLLVLGILIRRGDGGPARFVQQRFGCQGRPFFLYKLRSMHPDSEALQLPRIFGTVEQRPAGRTDDPRVTSLGHWLRRHCLDELPQLLNVIRGEMRLVGPRPLPEYEDWQYQQPWHRARLDGMPGMTGLWQVSGRNALRFEEMCLLDIWYLRNRSLLLDLQILRRTVRVVWRG
jgi:lipopolysaccharide/colanic/teichoic acid biosynthesis glycosyltransferase